MSKKFNKAVASTVACLVVSSVVQMPVFAATTVSGTGRVQTAIKIAEQSWNDAWKGKTEAILSSANDANLVDALSVAPFAFQQKAPILITENGDVVNPDVMAELKAKNIKTVYLTAGTGVLTDKMKVQLEAAGMTVVRLGGKDRFETAKNITSKITSVKGYAVVNSAALADALSVASIAAAQGYAIAIAPDKDTAPADSMKAGLPVVAVGGSGVLSDALVAKMGATRFGGSSRYETNGTTLSGLKDKIAYDKVYVANGETLVDALPGSVLAAQTNSPIVLAGDQLDAKQVSALKVGAKKGASVVQLGGAVSQAVVSSVESNLVPQDVNASVAKVADVKMSVANNLKDYDNTVLLGKPALVQAKVIDKDGAPLSGQTVIFSTTDAKGTVTPAVEGINVVTTNADGIATAVVNVRDAKATEATKVASVKVTASVVGSTVSSSAAVKFAAIAVNNVQVVNEHNNTTNKDDNLVPAKGSVIPAMSVTKNMSGSDVEYVSNQQVSSTDKNEHAVTFSAVPSLVLPSEIGASKTDSYEQKIDYKSGDIHPYENKSFDIKVPAGLQYATVNFAKMQVSAGSRVTFILLNSDKKSAQLVKTIDGEFNQNNFGYQIPKSDNNEGYLRVSIQSPGQVDLGMNGGVEITSLTGVYKNVSAIGGNTVALPNASIDWTQTAISYSDSKSLKTEDAVNLGITLQAGFQYSYVVPVFPFVGDAVITAKDTNGAIQEYYVVPTKNVLVGAEYRNTNDIDLTSKALLVSKDEAFNSVGSIKASANQVTVNSSKVGYTGLVGKINVPGFGSDLFDATNNTIYTAVQWAPLPQDATAVASSKKAFALVGQRITVKAQLNDRNGNPVAVKGQSVNWKYDDKDAAAANVSLISKSITTDINGQATLVFTSGDYMGVIKGLVADNSDYKVTLKIGNDTVEKAELHWVAAGLGFQASLDQTPVGPYYNTAGTVTNNVTPKAGSNWEYAYNTSGKSDKYSVAITGLNVNYTSLPGSVGTMAVTTGAAFKAGSTAAGIEQISGVVAQPTADAKFIVTENDVKVEYANVGEGATSIYSNLVLPISWKAIGQQAAFITPAGTNVADETTKTYIKVTDSLGNPLTGTKVIFTLTNGTVDGVSVTTTLTTDEYGIAKLTVKKGAGSQTIITAAVSGLTSNLTTSINWLDSATKADFALVNIGVNTTGTTDVIALTFSQPVNVNSVAKELFKIASASAVYSVKDVKVADNVVYLTLADSNAKLSQDSKDYMVSVIANTIKSGVNAGVDMSVADVYGRTLSPANQATLHLPSSYDVSARFDGTTLNISASNATDVAKGVVVTVVSTDATALAVDGVTGVTRLAKGIYSVTLDANGKAKLNVNKNVMSGVGVYINGASSQTFVNKTTDNTVAVNHAPQYVQVVAQAVKVGTPTTVTVAFTDEDKDALTYTAVSSDMAKVTVALNNGTLTLTGLAAGTAKVSVTANDGKESKTETIDVTVSAAADTPAKLADITTSVEAGYAKFTVDLGQITQDTVGKFVFLDGNIDVTTDVMSTKRKPNEYMVDQLSKPTTVKVFDKANNLIATADIK